MALVPLSMLGIENLLDRTLWWFGVTLIPEAAHVHSLRPRTIRWSQVAAVQTEGFGMGSRRVVLYETDGRHTPLRAPTTGFLAWDRTFDAKATVIHDWWLTRSGAADDRSATTTAAPGPLPDRLRLRLPVTQAGPPALLLGAFAVWLLSVAFLVGSGADSPCSSSSADCSSSPAEPVSARRGRSSGPAGVSPGR